jgi:hypothetical protein
MDEVSSGSPTISISAERTSKATSGVEEACVNMLPMAYVWPNFSALTVLVTFPSLLNCTDQLSRGIPCQYYVNRERSYAMEASLRILAEIRDKAPFASLELI